ncbi:radical SAM family heme chaperone HemW [Actinomyces mediterranea]|uniref:radical SAM family heme chaperone HemW n=1 Tax=Actinomyces mediterranea TaxID=1871028 RepID=UPI000970A262|nr:radical SAM family heme chaperone HemW [Actinomyces mediterranea]
MSPRQPDGIPWPLNGALDPGLVEAEEGRPLSLYLHVPFCRVRCGYCDFNTYTVGFGQGAEPGSYAASIAREARLAAEVLADAGMSPRSASTVFIGGGTPTLLDARELADMLRACRDEIGIAEGAEITVEANPDTVDARSLEVLAEAGTSRVSIGMQSAVPHVLAALDRTHTPASVPRAVETAASLGLDTSVDLIYGTPGESLADWETSLTEAIAMNPDHISAYALVIEEGTKMGAQVARGEIPTPDPDDEAAKYELADRLLADAGYRWYEISNFARVEPGEEDEVGTRLAHASRHNLAYWRDWDWWGMGPGAHSHIGRYRWWNVTHPGAYAVRLSSGRSPAVKGEILDAPTRALEKVMLAVRTAEGARIQDALEAQAVAPLIAEKLIEGSAALKGRIVLTLHGRLLADAVTRRLAGF